MHDHDVCCGLCGCEAAETGAVTSSCVLFCCAKPACLFTLTCACCVCLCALVVCWCLQVPPSAWLNECLQHLQDNMLAQANSTQQQQQLDTEVQQQHCDMQQQSQPVGTSGAATNAGDADSTTSSISSDSSLDTLSSSSSNPSSQQCCLSSQDLSNTIWALATLRIKPHSAWMSGYLSAGAATLSDATPQELTNSMWGLQVRAWYMCVCMLVGGVCMDGCVVVHVYSVFVLSDSPNPVFK